MSKKLKPCRHSDVYDENCTTCLYKELFEVEVEPYEPDSLEDMRLLLDLCED